MQHNNINAIQFPVPEMFPECTQLKHRKRRHWRSEFHKLYNLHLVISSLTWHNKTCILLLHKLPPSSDHHPCFVSNNPAKATLVLWASYSSFLLILNAVSISTTKYSPLLTGPYILPPSPLLSSHHNKVSKCRVWKTWEVSLTYVNEYIQHVHITYTFLYTIRHICTYHRSIVLYEYITRIAYLKTIKHYCPIINIIHHHH